MRIAVVGAGGVGGCFGGWLAAAGHNVGFVARGAHGDALAQDGLRVLSARGDLHLRAVRVVEDPAGLGPVDVALLAVKLFDLEDAARRARPLLAQGGVAIPLQNGVEAVESAARALPAAQLGGGVAYIAAAIERPGVVRHSGTMARLLLGQDGSGRLARFAELCRAAGVDALVTPDIEAEIWRKFVFLAPMAGATALRRQPIGAVLADAGGRALLEALVHETAAVGRAKGVRLAADLEARTLAFAQGLPFEMRSSMLNDLAAQRPLELRWLTGAVVRFGREQGVATPRSAEVDAALSPFAGGSRQVGPTGG